MKKLFPLILLTIFLVGCSNHTFDTSSEEAFSNSVEKIGKSASKEEKEALVKAVMYYSFKDIDLFSGEETENPSPAVKSTFEGRTMKEVLEIYETERKNDLTNEIKDEITRLEEKKHQYEQATDMVKQFEVSGRFELEESYIGSPDAIQTINITNNSSNAISKFKVKTTLASPDREIPWGKDDVYYAIPGGLAPGESGEYRFNAYDWQYLKFGESEPLLKVELLFVEDANEEKLFELSEFTDEDTARLKKLKIDLEQQ